MWNWDGNTDRGCEEDAGKREKERNSLGSIRGLALAAVFCLPQMLNLKGDMLAASNSWFSVLAYGLFWFLCYRSLADIWQKDGTGKEREQGRYHGLAAAAMIAGMFSLCIAFGVQLDCSENVDFRDGRMWLAVLVWTAVLAVWIYRGWMWLEQRGHGDRGNKHAGLAGGEKTAELAAEDRDGAGLWHAGNTWVTGSAGGMDGPEGNGQLF